MDVFVMTPSSFILDEVSLLKCSIPLIPKRTITVPITITSAIYQVRHTSLDEVAKSSLSYCSLCEF